ncbi:MAG: HEAT repeat domain-containing protein [Anaerolineae bacterium]|nr:HEAT repeat domain-containing protein [Anaerolineae bacterium]
MYASESPSSRQKLASDSIKQPGPRAAFPAHVSILIEALLHPNRSARDGAKKELVGLGDLALDELLAALSSRDDQYKWRILPVVAEIGGATALQAVMLCLESGNAAIRSAAAQILGRSHFTDAIDALLAQLNRPENAGSIVAVIEALGQLGDRRVIPQLVELMHRTEVPSVRYTAIEALGKIGDPSVIPDISRYIDDPSHHVRTRAHEAIVALTESRTPNNDLLSFTAE